MDKQDKQILGWAFVALVVYAAIKWLYETLGPWLFWTITAVLVAGFIAWLVDYLKSNGWSLGEASRGAISDSARSRLRQENSALDREVFDEVIDKIRFAEDVREDLFVAWSQNINDPRTQSNRVKACLTDVEWQWPLFDHWFEIFRERGEWPYMWARYSALCEPVVAQPSNLHDAAKLFAVDEIKALFKEQAISPRPAPKNRAQWQEAFGTQLPASLLSSPRVLEKYREYVDWKRFANHGAKAEILSHYLNMCWYKRSQRERSADIWQRWLKDGQGRIVASAIGCPIEEDFAERFNRGEITDWPPFFPGDRTALLFDRHRARK